MIFFIILKYLKNNDFFLQIFALAFKKWLNKNGVLLPKLFWPTVMKNCSSDQEKLFKFKVEGREITKFLWSLEQVI